jgi:hypothetical protein
MKHLGTLDLDKPILLDGKPHGIERVALLGAWTADDVGRIVFDESTSKIWVGRNAGWEEMTEGHTGPHTHDDLYYTETEMDAMFSGMEGGKMVVDWNQVDNPPAEYAPSLHGDSAHSVAYVTASGVTYENLSANGDVGSSAGQLAIGNHNHDAVYSLTTHNHSGTYAEYSHNHDLVYSAIDHTHTEYSLSEHNHDGAYASYSHTHTLVSLGAEPAIGDKNTAFNLNLGTTAGTVSEGNHNHDTAYATVGHHHNSSYSLLGHTHIEYSLESHDHNGVYALIGHGHTLESLGAEPEIGTKKTAFNVDFGTIEGTVSQGNHSHTPSEIGAEPEITDKKTAFNVDFGFTSADAARGNHHHDAAYEPIITKETGFNLALGTTAGTVSEGNHNHDSAYSAVGHDHDSDYAPIVIEVTSTPSDTPAIGTMRVKDDGSEFYIYTSAGWKTGTLA